MTSKTDQIDQIPSEKKQLKLKMSELCRASGYSKSTIYEYMRKGLLHKPVQTGLTQSVFNETHLYRLKQIRLLKDKEKLSLDKIKKTVNSSDSYDNHPNGTEADIKMQIIKKALALFSKRHYANTKISDITDALNVGSGTFYRYFKSKEDLFIECLEKLPKVMIPEEIWEDVYKETDFVERVKKRGYALLNAFPSYYGILNYAKMVIAGEDEKLTQKATECIKSIVRPLIKDVKDAMDRGEIHQGDEEMIGYFLMGLNETFGFRFLMDSKYTIEDGFRVIEEIMVKSFVKETRPHTLPQSSAQINGVVYSQGKEKIALTQIKLDDQVIIPGKFMGGDLTVPLENITLLKVKNTEGKTSMVIQTSDKQQVEIQIKRNMLLTGDSAFGGFQIPIHQVDRIELATAKVK